LVHIARLVEKKGTRYLIEAVAQIHHKFPELTVDIIGDGPLRHSLHAQVERLGIKGSVRFQGTQTHHAVRDMLKGATALVLPSVRAMSGDAEGLGLVLLEASAAGVPVIGTHHGGIPEAVRENVSGLLVPERDSGALAEAIDTVASDDALQRRLAQGARRLACERFDINRQSAELEALYRRVCQ
jgi:glycosyltransferase involved in cell wall biosynthesis